MKRINKLFLLSIITIYACKHDPEILQLKDVTLNNEDSTNQPPPTGCNDTVLPVVMVHGLLASGDTWVNQIQRFESNGYCSNRLWVFDWNTLNSFGGGGGNASQLLDSYIDSILEVTGAPKVNLVGHSAGGGTGYNYLNDASRAAKVAHYVHIGSGAQDGPAGNAQQVPTLNIYSTDDLVVSGADIPGATNVRFSGQDHYQVATSAETFTEMYKFFNDGKLPATNNIIDVSSPEISGRAVILGENAAVVSASIRVFEVNPLNGQRATTTPKFTLTTDNKGNWGPLIVESNKYYEFEISKAGERTIHYYREPFKRNNKVVYLRTLPSPFSVAGLALGQFPSNDNQAVISVFAANQAVVAGRDVLKVDNKTLSTEELSPASQTNIAFFLYDNNNNGQSDLTTISSIGLNTFLKKIDMFFPGGTSNNTKLEFNDRTFHVTNFGSETDGIVVAVFD